MRLYYSETSPFVRKVRVLVHEAGIGGVEPVLAQGDALDPGSMPLAHNPLGKIPVLVTDDGSALYDSRVICRYLDDLAGAGLYPPAPRLWQALTLESAADGVTEAAVLIVYERRIRPEALRYPPWVEGQWAKIARTLDALERDWAGYLAGPPDMAQIALACALGYLDLRLPARDWRAGRPGLAAWEAGFARRASMASTRPPV